MFPDQIVNPDVDESNHSNESPREYCRRIATAKALSVTLEPNTVVLSADTTVAVGRRILGKAEDAQEAEAYLRLLSGRRHRVITAVVVRIAERLWTKDITTIAKMKRLSEADIQQYIHSGEWLGKAGAYGIQGSAGGFIPWISGSFTAVVGLPLTETLNLLKAAGYCVGEAK